MAYNVKQLEQLQDMIGTEAEVPNALDRYNAMQLLKRRPVRREDGGDLELHNNAEELASKGRYGDTMLMHVTPDEVRGLSSLRGGVTINPETGLPEAFPWLIPVLAGAAIGGVGSAVTGGDPLKGAAFGALGGAMGPAIGGLTAGTALGGMWGSLGSIGQGMLVGGAMGGVRSLFGDSDNPMRDILMGAAMGGLGGAISGEPVSSASSPGSSTVQTEIPTVPMVEPGGYPGVHHSGAISQAPQIPIQEVSGTGSHFFAGQPVRSTQVPPPTSNYFGQRASAVQSGINRAGLNVSNPATTRVGIRQHPAVDWTGYPAAGRTSSGYVDSATANPPLTRDQIMDARNIDPTSVVDTTTADAAADATQDAAEKTGLSGWWD